MVIYCVEFSNICYVLPSSLHGTIVVPSITNVPNGIHKFSQRRTGHIGGLEKQITHPDRRLRIASTTFPRLGNRGPFIIFQAHFKNKCYFVLPNYISINHC